MPAQEGETGPACAGWHPDEADNCLNECASPACYREVYAAAPLEPGEVDRARWGEFQQCARDEAKREKQDQWRAARASET